MCVCSIGFWCKSDRQLQLSMLFLFASTAFSVSLWFEFLFMRSYCATYLNRWRATKKKKNVKHEQPWMFASKKKKIGKFEHTAFEMAQIFYFSFGTKIQLKHNPTFDRQSIQNPHIRIDFRCQRANSASFDSDFHSISMVPLVVMAIVMGMVCCVVFKIVNIDMNMCINHLITFADYEDLDDFISYLHFYLFHCFAYRLML